MAEIILGLGTSHSGQLNTPPDRWYVRRDKDLADSRIDFGELTRKVKAGIEKEITAQKISERFETCTKAIATLGKILTEVSPDILVVVGDDQHEQFLDDNMPAFCVYRGGSIAVASRSSRGRHRAWSSAEEWAITDSLKTYPAASELAEHLIKSLVDQGFDPACSSRLKPDVGIGHAFSFIYRRIMPSGQIPMLPFMVNTFYPPNQPTPRRCYELGKALSQAIKQWPSDRTVAIMGSGGLSHVIIDEEIDRMTLDAMMAKDGAALCNLPVERLNLGTSEIRNWIIAAGALDHLNMHLIDYVPCYRSEAGTGCAMAFAVWR